MKPARIIFFGTIVQCLFVMVYTIGELYFAHLERNSAASCNRYINHDRYHFARCVEESREARLRTNGSSGPPALHLGLICGLVLFLTVLGLKRWDAPTLIR